MIVTGCTPRKAAPQGWCHRGGAASCFTVALVAHGQALTRSRFSSASSTNVGVVKRSCAISHHAVIDLTHHIAPYDVRAGSQRARSRTCRRAWCWQWSPAAAGSGGRVADGKGVLVGPDNGLLAAAARWLAAPAGQSCSTDEFHLVSPGGTLAVRDVFAPVAAHLCNGIDLADLGRLVDAESILPGVVPLPRELDASDDVDQVNGPAAKVGVRAEVLWIDHNGNCQLNIGLDDVAPWGLAEGTRLHVTAGAQTRSVLRVGRAGSLGPGAVGLLVDGSGLLTLVLDRPGGRRTVTCRRRSGHRATLDEGRRWHRAGAIELRR